MVRHLGYLLAFYWFPVVGWAALIFSLSAVTGEKLPRWDIPYLDKAIHAVEFGILAVLLARALSISFYKLRPLQLFLVVLLIGGAYGIFDEWHQTWVPGRTSSPWDLLADLTGITLFLLFYSRRAA